MWVTNGLEYFKKNNYNQYNKQTKTENRRSGECVPFFSPQLRLVYDFARVDNQECKVKGVSKEVKVSTGYLLKILDHLNSQAMKICLDSSVYNFRESLKTEI